MGKKSRRMERSPEERKIEASLKKAHPKVRVPASPAAMYTGAFADTISAKEAAIAKIGTAMGVSSSMTDALSSRMTDALWKTTPSGMVPKDAGTLSGSVKTLPPSSVGVPPDVSEARNVWSKTCMMAERLLSIMDGYQITAVRGRFSVPRDDGILSDGSFSFREKARILLKKARGRTPYPEGHMYASPFPDIYAEWSTQVGGAVRCVMMFNASTLGGITAILGEEVENKPAFIPFLLLPSDSVKNSPRGYAYERNAWEYSYWSDDAILANKHATFGERQFPDLGKLLDGAGGEASYIIVGDKTFFHDTWVEAMDTVGVLESRLCRECFPNGHFHIEWRNTVADKAWTMEEIDRWLLTEDGKAWSARFPDAHVMLQGVAMASMGEIPCTCEVPDVRHHQAMSMLFHGMEMSRRRSSSAPIDSLWDAEDAF